MEIIQLSNRLVEYRKSNNMTIKEFSELSGISTALLSQLERGVGNPSLSVLNAISETMNTSLSSLFEEPVILENLVASYSVKNLYNIIDFYILTRVKILGYEL